MQNRIYNTKAVIEAGLISALIVVIMLASVYVPIFSLLGSLILPVPVTVLYIRHNYKVTLGAVIISAIIIAMFYNPISALTASILFGATGMTLGYCIKHDKKFSRTILYLAIASAVAVIIKFTLIFSFMYKGGVIEFLNQYVKVINDSFNLSKDIYIKTGMLSSEQFKPLEEMISVLTPNFILKLVPAMIVIMSFTSAYFNYIVTRSILKKLRYNIQEIKPFSEIYVNTRVGTLVVLLLIIGMLLDRRNSPIAQYFTYSSGVIIQLIFMLNGLALASYYLKNKFNMSKMFTVLVLVFTAMSQQLSIVYMYLGFADMIIDFRKLDPYRKLIKD